MPRVPTTKEVLPGASVNIILKADQPTGRTVSGRIADVLTRGNHPRGIKVRLTDGRRGYRDRRVRGAGAGDEPPAQNIGLDAYLTARPRGQNRGRKQGQGQGQGQDDALRGSGAGGVVSCPVCSVFEGDEAAVAHHVAGHFED
ncbi:uncharacterized protein BP01DRAFT_297882 [Aspergillus saccharolyticus JOP 1030-1]|uniref:UBZ4-type domain-containing protein n=1 Tax=Aspergillus saccharolyticus JOP 1030-1 TaxID=1450539 RepID=A0A318ZB83_9EURO|nr:hypothetical protein BP01DRAFT_297882 [Aspergillus saccharolyticus JOP 1030-1]PYH44701.1 hypothetical protein BP01DRAFT_297882 [Aspergillus saccharolyticus JOP 1030-1]